ncbi:MAG TPA: lipoprotein [Gammaproteobacteria bacterium]|nr:lipoprotein [Gammaproteobacteria bacterium]
MKTHRSRFVRPLLAAIALGVLASLGGCGQKGPLVLPTKPARDGVSGHEVGLMFAPGGTTIRLGRTNHAGNQTKLLPGSNRRRVRPAPG